MRRKDMQRTWDLRAMFFGVAFVIFLPVIGFAQNGAIAGVAKDTTGAVLPGVTVEASTPALIEKVRTLISCHQGEPKILGLRPCTYTRTLLLAGIQLG